MTQEPISTPLCNKSHAELVRIVEMQGEELSWYVASRNKLKDEVESLTSQLAAAGEQLRGMREALEKLEAHRKKYPQWMWDNMLKYNEEGNRNATYIVNGKDEKHYVTHVPAVLFEEVRKALALTPTAAEQQAKANAEKAELLDWVAQQETTIHCDEAEGGEDGEEFIPGKVWSIWGHESRSLIEALRAAKEAADA